MIRLLMLLAAFQLAAAQIPELDLPQAAPGLHAQDRDRPTVAWREFGRESGWHPVDWDRHHAFPHRVFGPALELPGGPIRDKGDLDQRLRAFLAGHPGLLHGGDAGLDQLRPSHLDRHGDVWHAAYHQTWQGRRVAESELVFRVSPEGRLMLAGSDLHPRLSCAPPRLSGAEAAQRAGAASTGLAVVTAEAEPDWVVLPLLGAAAFHFRSAWPCLVVLDDPEHIYRVFVDGITGEILWAWNEVRHVTLQGRVRGRVEEQQPSDPELPLPMPHLRLVANGVEFHTDSTGHFSVDVTGGGPWDLEGQCFGHFADVQRMDGPDAAFTLQMTATEQDLLIELDQAQIEELDAYHHTTRVHDFITGMDPSFTWLNEPLPVRVNINQTCNAYWDGSSINFFREGGGCPNTARVAGVVYHEYGHGINDRQYRQAGAPWGMSNGAMHEGLADVTSIYLQDESFVAPGWFIRNLDNTNRYPENISGQVHSDGLIIGGTMYDLRQSMGLDLVRPLHHFARWGTPDDPNLGRAGFEYFLEILLVDDDDGDLGNLTPNYELINQAFNAHGIGSVLTWLGTTFSLDEPPFIHPPMTELPLRAVIQAPAFVIPQAVLVHYWTADQPAQTVTLDLQDDGAWTGLLPGLPWNSVLQYYAEVQNDAGVEIVSPPGAPDQVYRTRFVWNAGIRQGFELEPAAEAMNEVWQWGTPQDGPGGAFEGERCWGTNLTGNYPDMTIARLVTDEQVVDDPTQVIVSLRHWMAVEEGWDGVNVELSRNNGPWQLITPLSGYDFTTPDNNALPLVEALTGNTNGWERLTFDLTVLVEPEDHVRLRLNLLTDTMVSDAGWYVDQLEFLGFRSPPVVLHEALRDSENGDQQAFTVTASVDEATVIERFDLIWRVEGGASQVLAMQAAEGGYQAAIPGPFWEQTVEYRLEVEGESGFVGFLPQDPASWFSFHVGPDQTPPTVAFRRPPHDVAGWSALWQVDVEAVDNLDQPLQAVWLEWREAAGDWQHVADLAWSPPAQWTADLDFQTLPGAGELEFRALARDGSAQQWESATTALPVQMGVQQLIDDFENPLLPGWQLMGNFTAQQNRVHSGSWALGTGDTGFYDPFASGRATCQTTLDLRQVTDPALVLWESWFLETGDDEAWIEVSSDGVIWEQLASRTGGRSWAESRLSLAPWEGVPTLRLRFGFQADGDNDGFHIGYFADNLRLVNQSGLAVAPPTEAPAGFSLGAPWPNPFNPICRVDLENRSAQALRLALHNLLGQEVAILHNGPLAAGRHAFIIDGQRLASGLYLLSASQEGRRETRRVLLVR
ncbi:MAG: hypothetical protein Q8O14_05680 [bacterium]|nr:hypothetical protein [bacterium]